MPKESLKDKLEGNELDLSLSNLTAVPVKEIAAIPKGTRLDLSCNLLTTITPEFCMLTHLVKIDLSKNHLTSLPDGFGSLQRLQHLDLYNNKLQTVPVSFCYLKNLKWLDLKDNPLLEPIARVAGDCLDEIQCKTCAKNVISYMKQVQSEEERQKQKLLQKERELEAARKIEEDKEKERKKAEKKAEKERRRKEYEANQAEKRQQEEAVDKSAQQENLESGVKKNGMKAETKYKKKTGLSCCGVLFSVLLGLVAILVGLYFYCETAKSDKFCQSTRVIVENYVKLAKKTLHQYTKTK